MFDPQINFWGSFDPLTPRFPCPCAHSYLSGIFFSDLTTHYICWTLYILSRLINPIIKISIQQKSIETGVFLSLNKILVQSSKSLEVMYCQIMKRKVFT